MDVTTVDRERLASAFREWSDAFVRSVPMYAGLAARIADDPELLDILAHAPLEQQLPVLLFNAVHSLVLEDPTLEPPALVDYHAGKEPSTP